MTSTTKIKMPQVQVKRFNYVQSVINLLPYYIAKKQKQIQDFTGDQDEKNELIKEFEDLNELKKLRK